jgi:starvation-inducible DNA-binding protein
LGSRAAANQLAGARALLDDRRQRLRELFHRVSKPKEDQGMTPDRVRPRRPAPLAKTTDLSAESTFEISAALAALLADCFALYLKTKNFHWHICGPNFHDNHLMLDDHGDQIFAMTDPMAERARKIGGTTLRSIGQIARLQRLLDNDAEFVTALDMLAELRGDNLALIVSMRAVHTLCDECGDIATASLLENWIDEAEGRVWFLYETTRRQSE